MNETNGSNANSELKNCQEICNDFHGTIEFIGKRWMGVIIYSLLKGPKRYHEILADIPGISDRLLTERLRDLETEGIVVKNVSITSQKKVEYKLTSAGEELEDVIRAVMDWVKAKQEL